MKIGVMISEGPYTHQAADSAYKFVTAAIAAGHEVPRVFFYHDGVNVATRLSVPPQDERHIQQNWTALAKEHGVDLVVRKRLAGHGQRFQPGQFFARKDEAGTPEAEGPCDSTGNDAAQRTQGACMGQWRRAAVLQVFGPRLLLW